MSRVRLTERSVVAADARKDKRDKKVESVRELDGFEYDKSKAKILKDVLHNVNVSLGTLLAAMKQIAMLKGSDVTPDGKIGGRGFIMEFREIKEAINSAVKELSDVTDSIADELTNPGWGLKEKELKKVKEEQEQVEEKAEKIEEAENASPSDEDSSEEKESTISPDDVKDSASDTLSRYKELMSGNSPDRVAGVLSKSIAANLLLEGE